jgi:hypothetical protein
MDWKCAGLQRLTLPELNDFYNGSFFTHINNRRRTDAEALSTQLVSGKTSPRLRVFTPNYHAQTSH